MDENEQCQTATVTACTTYLSYGVDGASKTTTTGTSSSCSSIVGCSATGVQTTTATTVTATPSSAMYMVYPRDGADTTGTNNIEQQMFTQIGVRRDPPYYKSQSTSTGSDNTGVNFWFVYLNGDQVAAIRNNQYVSSILYFYSNKVDSSQGTGRFDAYTAQCQ